MPTSDSWTFALKPFEKSGVHGFAVGLTNAISSVKYHYVDNQVAWETVQVERFGGFVKKNYIVICIKNLIFRQRFGGSCKEQKRVGFV